MKPLHHLPEGFREHGLHAFDNVIRNVIIVGFGNASGDTRKGIRVAAERDGKTDGLLEIMAVKESKKRRRNSALTGRIPIVIRADVITSVPKVIAEGLLNIRANGLIGFALPRHKDSSNDYLCALDALGVVIAQSTIFSSRARGER